MIAGVALPNPQNISLVFAHEGSIHSNPEVPESFDVCFLKLELDVSESLGQSSAPKKHEEKKEKRKRERETTETSSDETKEWVRGFSPEGYMYYYNTISGGKPVTRNVDLSIHISCNGSFPITSPPACTYDIRTK